ncbi:MAG TPA: hypothetical protein IAC41_08605 [Candidatus Merdenecus merdavium]|nr:hypothetical protein [Candidatus Merdenecus merdavium]
MKKTIIGMLSVYVLVLAAIYITRFVLNQYGLEYRSCVDEFRVFWTYKLSFFAVALLLFYVFLIQKKENKQPWFRITWTLIPIAYIIASLFLLLVLALGGFLDVPQEEMFESGYLKITEVKWTAVEYYYCEPISEYVRKPLTYPSHVINPEYE